VSPQSTARSRFWLLAFGPLFLAYHLPEVAARVGVAPGVASAALLLFFPLAFWLGRRGGPGPLWAYGLAPRNEWWAWLAALFLLAVVAKVAAIAVGVRWGLYLAGGPTGRAIDAGTWFSLLLVTLVPSLAEDILTRGVFAQSPLARGGFVFVVATAAVYVLNHVWRLGAGWREWFMLLCFGIAYGLAFWRTGTLWAALGLHWGWNFAGQAIDAAWQVDVHAQGGVKLLSAAVHLVMAVVVLVIARPGDDGPGFRLSPE
jgi:uncharacterized protein